MAVYEAKCEAPGIVWKIVAQSGDQLAAGAVLIIVESMKMEIPVSATRAGQVLEILVNEGDVVNEDQVVAKLQT